MKTFKVTFGISWTEVTRYFRGQFSKCVEAQTPEMAISMATLQFSHLAPGADIDDITCEPLP